MLHSVSKVRSVNRHRVNYETMASRKITWYKFTQLLENVRFEHFRSIRMTAAACLTAVLQAMNPRGKSDRRLREQLEKVITQIKKKLDEMELPFSPALATPPTPPKPPTPPPKPELPKDEKKSCSTETTTKVVCAMPGEECSEPQASGSGLSQWTSTTTNKVVEKKPDLKPSSSSSDSEPEQSPPAKKPKKLDSLECVVAKNFNKGADKGEETLFTKPAVMYVEKVVLVLEQLNLIPSSDISFVYECYMKIFDALEIPDDARATIFQLDKFQM